MAGNIKGITIQIGADTQPLQKALEGVNKNARDIQSELKQVDRLLKLDPTNTELMAQKQKLLSDAVSNTGDKLTTLKEAQRQVEEQFKNGDIGEDKYRAIQREVISTEQNLKNLQKQLHEVNNSWNVAGEKFQSFGNSAKSAGEKIAPLSAVAGAGVVGMVGLAVQAGKTADDINTLSKVTGVGVEELQKFKLAEDVIDVSTETMGKSLAKLTKTMDGAKSGTKDQVEAFERLKVSYKDGNGDLRDNEEVFYDVIKALGEVKNETERDAIAFRLFGKSAQDLNPLILGGADALKQIGEEAEKAGIILSEDALNSINEFNDGLDTMKGRLSSIALNLGAQIGELLMPIMNKLVSAIEKIAISVVNLDPAVLSIILGLTGIIAILAPLLIIIGQVSIGIGAVMKVIGGLQLAFTTAGGAAGIFGTVIGALTGPVALIIAAIVALIAIVVTLWKTNEKFREDVKIIWESIKDIFATTLDGIKEIVDVGYKVIMVLWNEYGQKIKDISQIVWETIKDIINSSLEVIKGIVKLFIGIFTGDWQKMSEGLKLIWQGLWSAVKSIVEGAWGLLSGAFDVLKNRISDWFTGLATNAVQWGKNLINGFIDGIKSMAGAVTNAVKNVIGNVKDYMGFNSPSKKGEGQHIVEWGYNMIDGFIEGINQALPELEKTMNSAIPARNADMKTSNRFNVNAVIREESDIRKVAKELYTLQQQSGRGRGVKAW